MCLVLCSSVRPSMSKSYCQGEYENRRKTNASPAGVSWTCRDPPRSAQLSNDSAFVFFFLERDGLGLHGVPPDRALTPDQSSC